MWKTLIIMIINADAVDQSFGSVSYYYNIFRKEWRKKMSLIIGIGGILVTAGLIATEISEWDKQLK